MHDLFLIFFCFINFSKFFLFHFSDSQYLLARYHLQETASTSESQRAANDTD